MQKIPVKLRAEMDSDPWYHRCAITGATAGKIEWHHNLIYASNQVNEKWCIIPLAEEIHDRISNPLIKDLCDWIMVNRASESDLWRYSKAVNLAHKKKYLNKRFGEWTPGKYPFLMLNS